MSRKVFILMLTAIFFIPGFVFGFSKEDFILSYVNYARAAEYASHRDNFSIPNGDLMARADFLGKLEGYKELFQDYYGNLNLVVQKLSGRNLQMTKTWDWGNLLISAMRTFYTCKKIDFLFLRKEIYSYIALHPPKGYKLTYTLPTTVGLPDVVADWSGNPKGIDFVARYFNHIFSTLLWIPDFSRCMKNPQNKAFITRVISDFATQNCEDLLKIQSNPRLFELARKVLEIHYFGALVHNSSLHVVPKVPKPVIYFKNSNIRRSKNE